jgi:hypothetical protein
MLFKEECMKSGTDVFKSSVSDKFIETSPEEGIKPKVIS